MSLETAKKVKTYDISGKENGFLIEIGKDGDKTTSYLTAAYPGCFKGFHSHTVREANYVCVKGKLDIILIKKDGVVRVTLDAENPQRLNIPINVPTGLENRYSEEAWLINVPTPAYDPSLKNEQLDFDEIGAINYVKNLP